MKSFIALTLVAFTAAHSFGSFGSFTLSDPYEPGAAIASLHSADNCAEFCPAHWVGDNICDYDQCYNEGCSFDGGDCDNHQEMHSTFDDHCSDGCWPGWEGDGYCDPACLTEACGFDHGDCDSSIAETDLWTGGTEAEDAGSFDAEAWWHDFGSISSSNWWEVHAGEQCSDSCPAGWEGDGICDWDQCYNDACDMDGGDCDGHPDLTAEETYWEDGVNDVNCAPGCYSNWPGDGWCDADCYNEACGFDHGDCLGTDMDFTTIVEDAVMSYGDYAGPSLRMKKVSVSVANKPTRAAKSGSVPIAAIGGSAAAVGIIALIALYVVARKALATTETALPTPETAHVNAC